MVVAQDMELVGPLLDLRLPVDRCKFLLSWVQAYRLLTVMSENLAPLQGRLALYDIIPRGDGRYGALDHHHDDHDWIGSFLRAKRSRVAS